MWKMFLTVLWLGILAGMDVRRKYVPIWFLVCGGIFVTIVSVYEGLEGNLNGAELIWSIAPGMVLLTVAVLTKKAGWADGVVLMLLGILSGFHACIFSFTLSMVLISVVSLALLALRKVKKNTKLPYLPFLCAGYLIQTVVA